MRILYSTPTNNHSVVENSAGLFGEDKLFYVVFKDRIVRSFEKEKDCYEWMLKKNLISKDEYSHLTKK